MVTSRIITTVRQITPTPLRPLLGKLRRALTPGGAPSAVAAPREMWALVGAADADYAQAGENFKQLFLESGLLPHHAVLDVGCGIGRAAAPLIDYLDDDGRYAGFDVMAEAIDWCRENIVDPRFTFVHADMQSDRYNADGAVRASQYVFPYPDASFDFVWLGSVFTHLLAADQARFAREIARVLKPGGISVVTWYLIDDEARASAGDPDAAFHFAHALDGCWTATPDLPESVIAYDFNRILQQYETLNLEITRRHFGVWRRQPIQDQDVLVARKRG
jgi:SAM-dependent methyltransferase